MQRNNAIIALVVGLVLGACTFVLISSNKGAIEAPTTTGPSPARPSAPVAPEAQAKRLVVLSPALTEVIFAMGQGGRVVGISDFCEYPPEAKEIPSCGGFVNPNYEMLESLEPDLVVVQGLSDQIVEYCDAKDQAYVDLPLDTLQDLYAAIDELGRRLGCPDEADSLAESMRAGLEQVRQAVEGEPPVPVFLSTGRNPGRLKDLMTCGSGTFLDELIAIAGGENVFENAKGLYPTPAIEELVTAAPEVILDAQPGFVAGEEAVKDLREQWSELSMVPAVRDGRVEVLTEEYILMPGPRVVLTARRFAEALHPEVSLGE